MSDTHAQTVTYVRESMLPEQEPPAAERGVIKWMRENLASSWLNAVLTLFSLLLIYAVLSHVLPWFLHSVWNARSLSECRDVFVAIGDGGDGGACWAVIRERWIQFLYGFYPSDSYWRPNLALVGFFVAILPVLFSDKVPRQMLWFTVIYPFVMPWLLWGGSFWVPVLAFAGLVVGYIFYRIGASFGGAILGTVLAVVTALLWWGAVLPTLDYTFHKLVAESRLESSLEQTNARLAALPGEITVLEEQVDVLDDAIKAEEEVKAAALGELTLASDTASEAAEAAIREELGVAIGEDGTDPVADSKTRERVIEVAKEAGQDAIKADAFAPTRAAVLESVEKLTVLNQDRIELARQINLLKDENSAARTLAANIKQLPDWLAEIEALEEEIPVLETALPATVVGYDSVLEVPPAVSDEDKAQLGAYLSAKEELVSLEIATEATYFETGRVGLRPVQSREFGGFLLALVIGLSGIVLSLPLGILLALGRQSNLVLLKVVSVAFIETIRGVPLIVWLLTAQLLLNYFLPPGTTFDLLLRVIIMVTLFASAYIAEVVRGGLAALPRGQYEAADALGLDYWKAQRLIVMPQALKISIPGIVNTFIGLFKDTVLVTFIGLLDPIGLAGSIRASSEWNGIYWELFAFIGLMFFVCCFSMGRYSHFLEVKLQREHR